MRLRSLFQDVVASEEAMKFLQFLFKVGEERVSADDSTCIDVPQYIQKVNTYDDLCNDNFESLEESHSGKEGLKNRAIITTKSILLQNRNEKVGMRFLEKLITFPSSEKTVSDEAREDGPQYPVNVLITLTTGSSLPDHRLALKVGFPC